MEYIFRDKQPRVGQAYSVLFSGIVEGYVLPDEDIPGIVERRLMPNGDYAWKLTAENTNESQTIVGNITIAEANSSLPIITTFTVSQPMLSPNDDGIADHVAIEAYLEQPASLRVFLIGESGQEYSIPRLKEGLKASEAGPQTFEYDGGMDANAEPPPDGTYKIVMLAQDDEGQRIRREASLIIEDGGKPKAEIATQSVGVDVVFQQKPYDDKYFTNDKIEGELVEKPNDPEARNNSSITMPIGNMLVFMLTVENYGNVDIRTTGPMPGTVYQQDQVAALLGESASAGSWRIGIQCDTSIEPFPYRWAVGSPEVLVKKTDPNTGVTSLYLPSGKQSVVWGAIRMTEIEKRQNPQSCWAGLIQEEIEGGLNNSVVGSREIRLVDLKGN